MALKVVPWKEHIYAHISLIKANHMVRERTGIFVNRISDYSQNYDPTFFQLTTFLTQFYWLIHIFPTDLKYLLHCDLNSIMDLELFYLAPMINLFMQHLVLFMFIINRLQFHNLLLSHIIYFNMLVLYQYFLFSLYFQLFQNLTGCSCLFISFKWIVESACSVTISYWWLYWVPIKFLI